MQKDENKAVKSDEKEMTEHQQYLANQIQDLRKKRDSLQFDLDQIVAALTVFENTFIASTKEEKKDDVD